MIVRNWSKISNVLNNLLTSLRIVFQYFLCKGMSIINPALDPFSNDIQDIISKFTLQEKKHNQMDSPDVL